MTACTAGPGRSVQHQTRRWLQRHGAGALSVVLDPGNRAAIASALALDWLVDDSLENATATALETDARVIWIAPVPAGDALRQARASRCLHAPALAEAVRLNFREAVFRARRSLVRLARHLVPHVAASAAGARPRHDRSDA